MLRVRGRFRDHRGVERLIWGGTLNCRLVPVRGSTFLCLCIVNQPPLKSRTGTTVPCKIILPVGKILYNQLLLCQRNPHDTELELHSQITSASWKFRVVGPVMEIYSGERLPD